MDTAFAVQAVRRRVKACGANVVYSVSRRVFKEIEVLIRSSIVGATASLSGTVITVELLESSASGLLLSAVRNAA